MIIFRKKGAVMNQTTTAHVALDPRLCISCWRCMDACPKGIIAKSGRIWHAHVIFKNSESCIGCRACIRTCPQGAFRSINETPSASCRQKMLTGMERMLLLFFLASAVTGINLHAHDDELTFGAWFWDTTHILTSLLWLLSAAVHFARYCRSGMATPLKDLLGKSGLTRALTTTFLLATVTGFVLMAGEENAGAATGMWHFGLGLLLIVFSSMHVIRKKLIG